MNQSGERSRYQVYILRLWRKPADAADAVESATSAEPSAAWRFVLEEPQTGQRRGFADFGALMSFLEMELQGQETKAK